MQLAEHPRNHTVPTIPSNPERTTHSPAKPSGSWTCVLPALPLLMPQGGGREAQRVLRVAVISPRQFAFSNTLQVRMGAGSHWDSLTAQATVLPAKLCSRASESQPTPVLPPLSLCHWPWPCHGPRQDQRSTSPRPAQGPAAAMVPSLQERTPHLLPLPQWLPNL